MQIWSMRFIIKGAKAPFLFAIGIYMWYNILEVYMIKFIKKLFKKKNEIPTCFGKYETGNIQAERCCRDCFIYDHCVLTSVLIRDKQIEIERIMIRRALSKVRD